MNIGDELWFVQKWMDGRGNLLRYEPCSGRLVSVDSHGRVALWVEDHKRMEFFQRHELGCTREWAEAEAKRKRGAA